MECETSDAAGNLANMFSQMTYSGLNHILRLEEEYKEWLKTTNSKYKDFQTFLDEKHEKADREYKAKYGYDPPTNGWDS